MKTMRKLLIVLCAVSAVGATALAFSGCAQKTTADYGEWEVMTAPTCEEEGVEIRVSRANPNVVQTRAIPATGHDWNEYVTVTEPACLVNGVEERTCKTCENSDFRAIPATGHSWGEWQTLTAPTCVSKGSQTRTCENDGNHTEYGEIEALGHDFGEWVVTLAPTCTTAGVETHYCLNNNSHTEVRGIEALGHSYSPAVITKQPTCTESGEKVSICANDPAHKNTETVEALGHDWGEWIVYTPATESTDGEGFRVCRNDATHTQTVIPAYGSEGLKYLLNNDGTGYRVYKKNSDLSGTIYIPAIYNGLPVTELGGSAFSLCRNIESIVFLGNNLRTINSSAFGTCTKLQSIEFPEGVTEINPYIFSSCTSLKSISFPSTVTSIGRRGINSSYMGILTKCPILESITVAEGNPVYKVENGCLIDITANMLIAGTVNSVIPDYITSIERLAFCGLNIESINIPASVTAIKNMAFAYCEKLNTVTFEDGALTEISSRAFQGCITIKEITIPASVTTIGSSAFSNCTSIERIVIPVSVTNIAFDAFRYWTEEQTIVIKGFASQEEADEAWGTSWRNGCNATIVYEG